VEGTFPDLILNVIEVFSSTDRVKLWKTSAPNVLNQPQSLT